MHISFIHIDTETFEPLSCTHNLTLWTFRWGRGGRKSVYPPLNNVFYNSKTAWGIELELWSSR